MLLIPPAVRKILEEGRRQGWEEAREEGRMEERAKWEAWLKRLNDAEANGVPFSDPPPSQRD